MPRSNGSADRSILDVAREPRRALTAGLLFFLSTAVASCDRRASEPAAADAATYGGSLVVAGPADLDAANPLTTPDAWTQEIHRHVMFMTLIRFGPRLELQPYLARSWRMEGDTAAMFELRRDVFWHDGRLTTAHDVRFTFERALDPKTAYPNASYFAEWKSVEVMDSFTLRLRFRPHADPLAGAALLPIVPEHLLGSVPPAELATAPFNQSPVGNGPFRLVSHQENDRWTFEADASFPRELGGRPFVDRLVWRVVPDRAAQVTELLTGNADLILGTPADQFAELGARAGIQSIVRPSFKYSFIGWNGKRAPFGDARVRRALTLAIDRKAILDHLRSGYGQVAVGPVHPNHWAYDESLQPLPFDTAAARALLAQAGIVDRGGDANLETASGKPFAFELKFQAGNTFSQSASEMIQADLARIGVRVSVRAVEWSTLVGDISSAARNFDAVLMGWESDFRVDVRDLFHSRLLDGPFQLASYRNAELDELMDRAALTADRVASLPLWHSIQRTLRDDQPWTFLYYYPDLILARDGVRGLDMDLRGVFAGAARWRAVPSPTLARR
ncbi:MAG: ABC transporter substrate-binding protein [Longimicrobiales bacterium]